METPTQLQMAQRYRELLTLVPTPNRRTRKIISAANKLIARLEHEN